MVSAAVAAVVAALGGLWRAPVALGRFVRLDFESEFGFPAAAVAVVALAWASVLVFFFILFYFFRGLARIVRSNCFCCGTAQTIII